MFCNSPHRRDDGGNWRAPACTGSDGRCTRYSVYLGQRLYFPRQYAREKHSKTRDTQSNTWKLQTWQFTISPRLYSHLSAAAILCRDVLSMFQFLKRKATPANLHRSGDFAVPSPARAGGAAFSLVSFWCFLGSFSFFCSFGGVNAPRPLPQVRAGARCAGSSPRARCCAYSRASARTGSKGQQTATPHQHHHRPPKPHPQHHKAQKAPAVVCSLCVCSSLSLSLSVGAPPLPLLPALAAF